MRPCSGHQLMEHRTVTWHGCKEDARKTCSQALSKASIIPFHNNKPNNNTVIKTEKDKKESIKSSAVSKEKINPASAVSQNTTQKHDASRNNIIDSIPLERTDDNSTTSSQALSKTCVRQLNNVVAKNNACKINDEQVLKSDVSISKKIEENDKVCHWKRKNSSFKSCCFVGCTSTTKSHAGKWHTVPKAPKTPKVDRFE